MLDDALYDSFGQRQISTMFTQLTQYRVVLEAQPGLQQRPEDLQTSSSAPPPAAPCRWAPSRAWRPAPRPWPSTTRAVPAVTVSFNLARDASLGTR